MTHAQSNNDYSSSGKLDPAGFTNPLPDGGGEGVVINFTVIQPADNTAGMKLKVYSTFEEAQSHALRLQSEGVEELVILRNHEIYWKTPGLER